MMQKKKQLEKVRVARPLFWKAEIDAIRRVLVSGRLAGNGPEVEIFEREFAEYIGTKYAVAVNSGTAALHLALLALGIAPGDRVVVPPLGFFATIEAVLYCGAEPVFCDVDEEGLMTAQSLAQAIEQSSNVKAAIPVHLFGNVCDMDSLRATAQRYKIALIEDAAQAHGAQWMGFKTGSWGEIGCFSFYATKHLTTAGEGGMLTTSEERYAHSAQLMRSHGMNGRQTHIVLGYNYRMSEIAAAMGRVQLRRLDDILLKRQEISEQLLFRLDDIEWIRPMWPRQGVVHAYFWCPIYVKPPIALQKVLQHLVHHRIEVRYRYTLPLYDQPVLLTLLGDCWIREQRLHCPVAEQIAGRFIGLPNRYDLTPEEIDRIIEALKTFKS